MMPKANHTPGPSQVDIDSATIQLWLEMVEAQGNKIHPSLRAKIAAAPALLEALEGLMEHYVGERSSKNVVGPSGIAADKARAALLLVRP